MQRAILAISIHELWGQGLTLPELHDSIKATSSSRWPENALLSFRFDLDSFRGSRQAATWLALINSFAYMPFKGTISMKNPDAIFTLFEHWTDGAVPLGLPDPERYYFGRFVAHSAREIVRTLDLKKRRYISTTSMDSELALVTANIALAGPGKLFYDPFVGTGSFPIAAAQWGALCWGSDIDGRTVRGDEKDMTLKANFEQYGLLAGLGDVFTADLTNSPVRRAALREHLTEDRLLSSDSRRIFDGIICDPPYGVREGLRVLGIRNEERRPWMMEKVKKHHKFGLIPTSLLSESPGSDMLPLARDAGFVPPKQPYSFLAILNDILEFAAETLVDNGRLAFWMPTANDMALEIPVPTHPCLEVMSISTQAFNKCQCALGGVCPQNATNDLY
jgi:tRNA (guanine10-N2)-methyltransferase